MYLTPPTSSSWELIKAGQLGVLFTPQSYRPGQWDLEEVQAWAADNGCFSQGDSFELDAYLEWLDSFSPAVKSRALFATAPDVVGDWEGTLARSSGALRAIRLRGFPAALVAQDGLEEHLDQVPWEELDWIFIGGSTEWKLGPGAQAVMAAATKHRKRIHVGRVNSTKRALLMGEFAHTWDGTLLTFGPEKNLPRTRAIRTKAYEAFGDLELDANPWVGANLETHTGYLCCECGEPELIDNR